MEPILLEIIAQLNAGAHLDEDELERIIRSYNKRLEPGSKTYAKKRLLPYYLRTKEAEPERFARWHIDAATEKRLIALLRVKPRRTASGVATITVMTKPWRCTSNCIYCPNDVRMPKSYLGDEPVCQRAERNYFDPYLQVTSRLRALHQMGHVTDKVELIVLGGTWSDYPVSYQTWFMTGLFRALNDGADAENKVAPLRAHYRLLGLTSRRDDVNAAVASVQASVNEGAVTFNDAINELYLSNPAWRAASAEQTATLAELHEEHARNVRAKHRVVGLVVETRPDTITPQNLTLLRSFGCTKIQIGVQSLDEEILAQNHRTITRSKIEEAFALLRIFGFKIHAHMMLNLLGSTPESDKQDYARFVTEAPFQPDEVKLYPCSLVQGTGLVAHYKNKTWRPYTHDELLDVLVADTLITPSYLRISRMIRDISAHDIMVGNKKANLRQMVEGAIEKAGASKEMNEIRFREVSTGEVDVAELVLDEVTYETSNTREFFLQWITPEKKIAGFLRLSLPHTDYVEAHTSELPVGPREAMIREVHVYGKVAGLHKAGEGAQHLGLGKQLITRATQLAHEAGYKKLNVISAVGTRGYYESLGFVESGLYQQLPL